MSLSFYIHLSATIQKPSSDISKPSRNTFFTFRTLDHRKQQLEVKEDKIKECLSLTYVLIQVLTSLPSRLHLFQVERRISSGRVGARLGVRVCCVSRGRRVELVISSAQLLDIILEILQKRKAGDQTSVYNTKRPFYDPGRVQTHLVFSGELFFLVIQKLHHAFVIFYDAAFVCDRFMCLSEHKLKNNGGK